jgi:hypothetical protein
MRGRGAGGGHRDSLSSIVDSLRVKARVSVNVSVSDPSSAVECRVSRGCSGWMVCGSFCGCGGRGEIDKLTTHTE